MTERDDRLVGLIGPPQADGEYVKLFDVLADEEVIVHLHDYARLYATPGLYEQVVQGTLGCCSPEVATRGLADLLGSLDLDVGRLRLLDLGAGTGLVGELVRG